MGRAAKEMYGLSDRNTLIGSPSLNPVLRIHFLLIIICCLWAIFFLMGCATGRTKTGYGYTEFPEPDPKGMYHKVARGETLWRIAKAYEVPLQDIVKANNMPNEARIEENQLIFIPGAYSDKETVLDTGVTQKEFIWPLKGKIIGYFHEGNGLTKNKGIDIQIQDETQVKAARSGKVIFADYLMGYQYTVILDHADGYYSVYAQTAKLLVKLGDKVSKSQVISELNRNDDLAFLHFEIRRNSVEDNPLYYLP